MREKYIDESQEKHVNINEQRFFDSLYNHGYFNFYTQVDSVHLNNRSIYTIGFSKYVNIKDLDTLKNNFTVISKDLANHVYKKVIPDSLIYRDFEIRFSYNVIDTVMLSSQFEIGLEQIYQIDSLEKWNGFKVIKKDGKIYQRVFIDK